MTTREELTRQAERCLRQGRLDEAIALYQDLADLAPTDWGIVKQLADLLERAGQREGAAAQFARWADYLFAEGFHSKAAALYRKVLKLEPLHEHALWQLGEVSVALKLRADARVAFGRVAELRQRRNDSAGVDAARRRLEMLEGAVGAVPAPTPWTPPSGLAGLATSGAHPAPAHAPGAAVPVAAPAPLVAIDPPSGVGLASPVPAAAVSPAPRPEAGESPAVRLARLRDEAMRADVMLSPDARDRWMAVLDADPEDVATRLRLIRRALERGDAAEAVRLAAPIDAGDPAALVLLMEVAHAAGGAAGLETLVCERVGAGAGLADLAAPIETLSRRHRDAARAAYAAASGAWHRAGQPASASALIARADALGLVDPALALQWVETCAAANLPELSRAQAVLVETSLTSGRVAEARAFAEDLYVREAGAAAPEALLRRVLERAGVGDADAVLVSLLPAPAPEAPAVPVVRVEGVSTWADILLDDPPTVAAANPDPVVQSAPGSLDAWPAPTGRPASAESQPPAATASGEFDWADLLGRDLGIGTAPIPPAEPPSDVQADDDASIVSTEPVVPVVDAELPVAVEASVIDDPAGATTADAAATAEASSLAAVDPPVMPPAPPEPGVSLLATIEARQAQPSHDAGAAPTLPALSTPRGWLSGRPDEPTATGSRQHQDDPYFFDDVGPARWARRRPASPDAPVAAVAPDDVAVAPESGSLVAVSTPLAEPEPTPERVPDIGALLDGRVIEATDTSPLVELEPAGVPSGAEAPGTVDEEIDLTQLLEELKQWDPVLPEPLRRTPPAPAEPAPATAEAITTLAEPEPASASPDPVDGLVVAADERSSSVEPHAGPPAEAPELSATSGAAAADDEAAAQLDALFAGLPLGPDTRVVAEQQLAAGRVFLAAGLASEAARAFERASGEPRTRFEAARALGDLNHSRGQLLEAVRWFERAAEAPVPDAAVKRAVLYDLAESLEALGEFDRALGVLLDLLSQVEDYRDARVRLDRLLRVDAGG